MGAVARLEVGKQVVEQVEHHRRERHCHGTGHRRGLPRLPPQLPIPLARQVLSKRPSLSNSTSTILVLPLHPPATMRFSILSTITILASSVAAAPTPPLVARETAAQATDRLLFTATLPTFLAARAAQNPSTLDWSSDGCSSSPDNPFGFNFENSCYRHDFGYRNFKAQSRFTDVSFPHLSDMWRKTVGVVIRNSALTRRTLGKQTPHRRQLPQRPVQPVRHGKLHQHLRGPGRRVLCGCPGVWEEEGGRSVGRELAGGERADCEGGR
jgi:hypothetical protein